MSETDLANVFHTAADAGDVNKLRECLESVGNAVDVNCCNKKVCLWSTSLVSYRILNLSWLPNRFTSQVEGKNSWHSILLFHDKCFVVLLTRCHNYNWRQWL